MPEGVWPVKVRPLPWYGGKAGYGKAEWICSLLPWRKDSVYVEPFGGMAGVMARRAPVSTEIYNDLDGRVVNWWRQWRERPNEMTHLVTMTPWSREEYERAWDSRDCEDDLQRAWAFHVVVNQGIIALPDNTRASWNITHSNSKGSLGRWMPERCRVLAERFWNVQLENVDAVTLIARVSESVKVVMYCDPPYRTATTNKYQNGHVDTDSLTSALLAQRGQVAISGYGDEWSHLGWQRHELDSWIVSNGANKISEPRTEVLWTNYDAHSERAIGGLFAAVEA